MEHIVGRQKVGILRVKHAQVLSATPKLHSEACGWLY